MDELKLIAQSRNISDYENESEKDLVKHLANQNQNQKIRINKNKLEEIRKDFYELRHKFSKKEIDKYRKDFHDIKINRYLSASEIEEARKNLNKLKKVEDLKSLMVILIVLIMMILIIIILPMVINTEKIGSIRTLFNEFDRDYYKLIRTIDGLSRRRNNYIGYKSKRGRYENSSPEKYLKMIRPYLRELINEHKPTMESNNEENEET